MKPSEKPALPSPPNAKSKNTKDVTQDPPSEFQLLERLRASKRKHDGYLAKQKVRDHSLPRKSARLPPVIASTPRTACPSQRNSGPAGTRKKSDTETRKYEIMLQDAADLVDTEATGKLSFDGLGKLMSIIGFYRRLFSNKCGEQDFEGRKQREMTFHHNFWRMFADGREERVDWKPIQGILTLLYSSDPSQSQELISSLTRILVQCNRLIPAPAVPEWNVEVDDEKSATRWRPRDLIRGFSELLCKSESEGEARESRIQFVFQPLIPLKESPRAAETKPIVGSSEAKSRDPKLIGSNSTGNINDNLMSCSKYKSPVEQGVMERISLMCEKQKAAKEKLKKKEEEVRKSEVKECTFRPSLGASRLTESASQKNFAASGLSSRSSSGSRNSSLVPRRSADFIAKRIQSWKKRLQLKNPKSTPQKTHRSKCGGNEKSAAMRVEVMITPQKTETIIVHRGDNIRMLVEGFAQIHGLDGVTKAKLQVLLLKHVEHIL